MKRIFIRPLALFGYVFLLLACGLRPTEVPPAASRTIQALPAPQDRSQTRELVGDRAVADLRNWYSDTRTNCGGESRPAFLCTGVMLRATENNQAFLPWNPNPSSTGVSFSWLRSDTTFAGTVFNYKNGFIFYPKDVGAAGSGVINVLCVFPHDSDTNFRESNGCGKHASGGEGSGPCDQQGIATGSQWIAHFNALAGWNKYIGQCGWNVRVGASTAAYFMAFIDGRKRMELANWYTQNEVRMAIWTQNAVVPLRAFFYLSGDSSARDKAKDDQRRYKAAFNQFAPVIRLTLPSSPTGTATFAYNETEQAVPDPGGSDPGTGIDPDQTLIDFDEMPEQSGVTKITYTNGSPFAEGASMSIARSAQTGKHLQTSAPLIISASPGKTYREIHVYVSSEVYEPYLAVTIFCSGGTISGAVYENGYYALACGSSGTFSKVSFDNHSKLVRFDDVLFGP